MFISIFMCMYVCVCMCVYVCRHICMNLLVLFVPPYIYIYMYVCMHTWFMVQGLGLGLGVDRVFGLPQTWISRNPACLHVAFASCDAASGWVPWDSLQSVATISGQSGPQNLKHIHSRNLSLEGCRLLSKVWSLTRKTCKVTADCLHHRHRYANRQLSFLEGSRPSSVVLRSPLPLRMFRVRRKKSGLTTLPTVSIVVPFFWPRINIYQKSNYNGDCR